MKHSWRCAAIAISILSGSTIYGDTCKNRWYGFERHDFILDGHNGYLVVPDSPVPGNPWVWRARFPQYHPEIDISLVARGFHLVYMDVAGLYGNSEAVTRWDTCYSYVTREWKLAPKMTLEGVSRGGLIVYNWAKKNPEKVNCIYVESPVCDFKSWPGGKGCGMGSPDDWQQLLKAYQLTEEEALHYKDNPIDHLEALAAAKVPARHVVCANDKVVPPDENTAILQKRYSNLGGPIEVLFNQSEPQTLHGHHFPLDDPKATVEFILHHTPEMKSQTLVSEKDHATPFGRDYFRLRGGLENCRLRFLQEKSGRVAFLGGSITYNPGWRNMVGEDLQRRFPETAFEFVEAGIPSMGSTPGAYRLERDVLSRGRIDLLFVEAAVNDDTNQFSSIEQIRGMEGIVRHARLANPTLDIVMMHFVDPGKIQTINSGDWPDVIAIHEIVADYYNVPSLNPALEVTERILAREFTWENDFKDLHPSPFGQELYFKSISRLFDAAWIRPANERTVIQSYELPDRPYDTFSYYDGHLVDIHAAQLSRGWHIDERWTPNDRAGTREGFVNVPMLCAEKPNAELRFAFTGKAVGILVAAGPDTGSVEYSVDGEPFKEKELFTAWSEGLHLPWAYVLEAELNAGPHELILRTGTRQHEKSKGYATRIAYFLVNGPSE